MNLVRLLFAASLLLCPALARALEAGAAKERVLPPPGATLDGDASRLGRPASGEHDPLWVRCLYLTDGTQQVFIVNVDAYRITAPLRANVVALAAAFAPAESIILTATHTPNGPGGLCEALTERWCAGRWNPDMLETLSTAAVSAMSSALEQKRRATVGYGGARPRGLSVNALDPKGPVDDQVGVVRVDDADGKAIAILTCFSAAPLPVPEADRDRFSAGYAGAYYRKMEALTDPGCVALLLMGAGGDQHPGNPENKSGWERVESVGDLLAVSAKSAANDMTFHDASLILSYREVTPPASLSPDLSGPAILQLLEIDGLLLTFLPGIPSVGIGQELRRQSLAEGYRAQFTVGLANGYLGYFTAPDAFAVPRLPESMQRYGPELAPWLYDEVMSLARGAASESRAPQVREVYSEPLAGGTRITLQGPGFDRGYQRAAAYRPQVNDRYADRVAGPVQSGALRPIGPYWELWPALLDPSPVALSSLGLAVRPLLLDLPADIFQEVEGYARSAELPFDAAWLLQNASLVAAASGVASLDAAPRGTMFAVLGELAPSGAPLLALELGWTMPGEPTISEVRPDEGRAFVQVGLDWQLGARAGLNDAGIALALERNEALGTPELAGAPATLLLRQVLQFSGTYQDALNMLQDATRLRGYQILLLGPGEGGWRGALVRYGKRVETRAVEAGVLLGVDPDIDNASPAAEGRYRHMQVQMQGRDSVNVTDAVDALALLDREAGALSRGTVVIEPGTRTLRAAFAAGDGAPDAFTDVRLKESANHE